MLNQPQPGADRVGGGGASMHVERDNRGEALELASRCVVRRVARQAGISRLFSMKNDCGRNTRYSCKAPE
jgi:hypothetical protein